MKPKTFTYNQMIQFFMANSLPLSEKQVHLIGTKVKAEMEALEAYRDNKMAKRLNRKRCKEVQKSGSNRPGA